MKMSFFYKESKFEKEKKIGGGEGGRGIWTGRRTGPNQFVPSTSSKLGA